MGLHTISSSNYVAQVDPELCVACGNRWDRCPMNATAVGEEDIAVVDEKRCIGCGVCTPTCDPEVNLDRCFGCAACATGCPSDAIVLESKPDFPIPPRDMKELITSLKASFSKQA